MNSNSTARPTIARYISPDRRSAVFGRWWQRLDSSLYLGEITVTHLGEVIIRFSSTMVMTSEQLGCYYRKFCQ